MSFFDLHVHSCRMVAEATRELVLRTDDEALPGWTPGAHVDVQLPDGSKRSYSLIDSAGGWAAPGAYRLGVRLETGGKGGSQHMHALASGDRLRVSAPKNGFALDVSKAPALLVAGGIGITPLVSMAAALTAQGRDWRMIHAARHRGAVAFSGELPADRVTWHLDDVAGGPADLGPVLGAAAPGTHLYVCGPRPMIDAARAHAEAAGFTPDRIHFELFEAAAPEAGDQPFEVEINDSRVFTVPAGQTILQVLEAGGVDIMYDCRRGDCGICRTDVRAGTPDHRDVVLSQSERDSGKVMQICVSRAKGGRLVLDI